MDGGESAGAGCAYWAGAENPAEGGNHCSHPKGTGRHLSKEAVLCEDCMRWLRNLLKGRTGGRTMAALAPGTKAPEFELKALDGERFSLNEELAGAPVVLVFFKVSCPTCQYALPFFERLYKAYGHKGVALVGVSQ